MQRNSLTNFCVSRAIGVGLVSALALSAAACSGGGGGNGNPIGHLFGGDFTGRDPVLADNVTDTVANLNAAEVQFPIRTTGVRISDRPSDPSHVDIQARRKFGASAQHLNGALPADPSDDTVELRVTGHGRGNDGAIIPIANVMDANDPAVWGGFVGATQTAGVALAQSDDYNEYAAGGATTPMTLAYARYGAWGLGATGGGAVDVGVGTWGAETPNTNLPTGQATFNGEITGATTTNNVGATAQGVVFRGPVEMVVDFDKRRVTGNATTTVAAVTGAATAVSGDDYADFGFRGNMRNAAFEGRVSVTAHPAPVNAPRPDVGADGRFEGAVYGTGAEEIGGSFLIGPRGSSETTTLGTFVGKQ